MVNSGMKEGVIHESQHEKSDQGNVPQNERERKDYHGIIRQDRTARRVSTGEIRQNAEALRLVMSGQNPLTPMHRARQESIRLFRKR